MTPMKHNCPGVCSTDVYTSLQLCLQLPPAWFHLMVFNVVTLLTGYHLLHTVTKRTLFSRKVFPHQSLPDVLPSFPRAKREPRVVVLSFPPAVLPSFPRVERERVTVSNVASTMASIMCNNPLLPLLDLACLRLLSCGGSPQPPQVVRR